MTKSSKCHMALILDCCEISATIRYSFIYTDVAMEMQRKNSGSARFVDVELKFS